MLGTKILEERKSKYNGNLCVIKTWGTGTYIKAGGLTQSGGIVESIWKNTFNYILHTTYDIQNVLILGLGGGTVAELLRKKYPSAKITGVDIDPLIVELGKKYLGLDRLPVRIHIADAYLYTTYDILHTRFDLVVVDLYVGDKFPKKFESDKFIKSLTRNKIVIFNRLRYKGKKQESEEFGVKLRKVFKNVKTYLPPANIMYICSN